MLRSTSARNGPNSLKDGYLTSWAGNIDNNIRLIIYYIIPYYELPIIDGRASEIEPFILIKKE
jgi:hypothetical protein